MTTDDDVLKKLLRPLGWTREERALRACSVHYNEGRVHPKGSRYRAVVLAPGYYGEGLFDTEEGGAEWVERQFRKRIGEYIDLNALDAYRESQEAS